MSEWAEIKLGEIASFSYGTMPKKEKLGNGPYPTFSGYRYQYKYPEYNCENDDLIVVARGVGGTGDVKIVKEKCYLTNLSIKIGTDKSKVDNRFLYYFYAVETLRYLDSGSAQSQITIADLSKAIVSLPNLEEQKSIASVLSSLDDKIDLLHRQNKTLESMAETLFRQWFVEEAGDWEVVKLGDVADLGWGDTNTTKASYVEAGYLAYSASGPDGFMEHYDFDKNGIVVSAIGANCGKIWFATGKWSCIKNTIRIFANDGLMSEEYLFFLLNKPDGWPVRGSAQPFISQTDARNIEIPYPPKDRLMAFNAVSRPIFKKTTKNIEQIKLLEKLRDNLLPKLMSGEVRCTEPAEVRVAI